MARGKWLSEEERAKIVQMHEDGVSTAKIAAQMERGVKSIQRVLMPPTKTDKNGSNIFGRKDSSTMPVEEQVHKEVPVQSHARQPDQYQHTLQHVPSTEQSTQPQKIYQSDYRQYQDVVQQGLFQGYVSPLEMNHASPATFEKKDSVVGTTMSATSITPNASQAPTLLHHMPRSSVTMDINRQPQSTSSQPQQQQQQQHESTHPDSVKPHTPHQQSQQQNQVPRISPETHSSSQAGYWRSLVEVIPNYDSDIETSTQPKTLCRPSRLTSQATPRSTSTISPPTASAKRAHNPSMQPVNTLSGFDQVLESTQDQEEVPAKRRRPMHDNAAAADAGNSIELENFENAMVGLQKAISKLKTPESGIFEEHLYQLFVRFQADVRLITLTRKQEQLVQERLASHSAAWAV